MATIFNSSRNRDFVRTGTGLSQRSGISIESRQSTQSTRYDSTEAVFTTSNNTLGFDKKTNLETNGRPAQGIQTVDIPMWKNHVKVYLGERSKDEAKVFYTYVDLPPKVYRNRLRGHYKQLYVKSFDPESPNDKNSRTDRP